MVGIEDMHMHDLLHRYASTLAGWGVSLYAVGNCLGMLMW